MIFLFSKILAPILMQFFLNAEKIDINNLPNQILPTTTNEKIQKSIQGIDNLKIEKPNKLSKQQKKIVEVKIFFNFQCTHCKNFLENIEKIINNQNIKIKFFHFPFNEKENLVDKASICAQNQEKFLEMKNKIFNDSLDIKNITSVKLKKYAQEISLDTIKFNQCLSDKLTEEKLQQDIKKGESLNVRVIPLTFVENEKIIGNVPLENIEKIIRKYQK